MYWNQPSGRDAVTPCGGGPMQGSTRPVAATVAPASAPSSSANRTLRPARVGPSSPTAFASVLTQTPTSPADPAAGGALAPTDEAAKGQAAGATAGRKYGLPVDGALYPNQLCGRVAAVAGTPGAAASEAADPAESPAHAVPARTGPHSLGIGRCRSRRSSPRSAAMAHPPSPAPASPPGRGWSIPPAPRTRRQASQQPGANFRRRPTAAAPARSRQERQRRAAD